MRHRIEALIFVVGLIQGAGVTFACTPEQRGPARTALEANQCVNAVVIAHIDAGDDFTDHKVLAAIAAEIAAECTPFQKAQP